MKSKMKYLILATTILMIGCSSTVSCDGFKKFSLSPEDKAVISRDLKEDLVVHNMFGAKTCGW